MWSFILMNYLVNVILRELSGKIYLDQHLEQYRYYIRNLKSRMEAISKDNCYLKKTQANLEHKYRSALATLPLESRKIFLSAQLLKEKKQEQEENEKDQYDPGSDYDYNDFCDKFKIHLLDNLDEIEKEK